MNFREKLTEAIDNGFKTRREFIVAFNKAAGFPALTESNLSRQLSGTIELSAAWKCAYTFFFNDKN